MISPHNLVLYKLAGKTLVAFVAVEAAAFQITPELFNSISVGVGALFVGMAAVIGLVLHARSDRKALAQHLLIATDQAAALKMQGEETAKISIATHEIKVSMDGRMDELLNLTRSLANAEGIKAGRAQVHEEQAAVAAGEAAGIRDDKIVEGMIDRIDQAADKAAQTMPGSGVEQKTNGTT
jgi:hypothetical protein